MFTGIVWSSSYTSFNSSSLYLLIPPIQPNKHLNLYPLTPPIQPPSHTPIKSPYPLHYHFIFLPRHSSIQPPSHTPTKSPYPFTITLFSYPLTPQFSLHPTPPINLPSPLNPPIQSESQIPLKGGS